MSDPNELLRGAKIKEFQAGKTVAKIVLEDGRELYFFEDSGPGADAGWCTFPVLKLGAQEIWRG